MGLKIPLPVDGVLAELRAGLLGRSSLVLTAPPGSGKTTRVPPAVAEVVQGKVLLLQPRRVAARSCAKRIAFEDGTPLGTRVGYHVRFDRKATDATEILVLTEGLLTRWMQRDPFLEGVGAVILDEFHERSLQSDMALAMLKEVVAGVRPDLKIIVMSATLDVAPVVEFLGGHQAVAVVSAGGRCFDVSILHQALDPSRHMEPQVAKTVRQVVSQDGEGHVLVFLPGVAEIERVRAALRDLGPSVDVLVLHGRIKAVDQDRAIAPSCRRKVILATNIAETSVTIDGVTTVIDTGLVRRPRFDPRLGVERLETVPVSLASAEQRAGRAGRTQAGQCVRLWSASSHGLRDAHDLPAVALADLASTVLELYFWGTTPSTFGWFQRPPAASVAHAVNLLTALHALKDGQITEMGRALARLPVHPRLGRVVAAGLVSGVLHQAAGAAALASERDPWPGEEVADLLTRLDWLDTTAHTGADVRALSLVRRVRDDLVRVGGRLKLSGGVSSKGHPVVAALVAGFPDRVGKRREPNSRSVLLASGVGVELGPGVGAGEWMVAVTMTAGSKRRAPLIRVAAEIDPQCLETHWKDEAVFDKDRNAVRCQSVRRWGRIVIAARPAQDMRCSDAVSSVLAAAAAPRFARLFPETGDYGDLLARLRFAESVSPNEEWPDWIQKPELLLGDWVSGRRSFEALQKINLCADLASRLPWNLKQRLDTVAPERMTVPSGAKIRLEYPAGAAPVLAARVQQMFGLMHTPKLGGVAITVQLLAPNGRPAQVTKDLAGFWATSYAEVRKALRGRYPRHAWPEDPSVAIPENRPKRRRPRS